MQTPTQLIDHISKQYGLETAEVLSETRRASVVWARHIIWYVLHTGASMSYPEIGRDFGMHHTTVIHGVERIRTFLQDNPNTLTAHRVRDWLGECEWIAAERPPMNGSR